MISRYSHPEMSRIWTDQRRYDTWLRVETAAAEAMAEAGMIPADAARDIRERGAVDAARVDEIEATTQHDVIAFTTAVAERVGESARWLHFGLTSSDVLDTALALQMREACDLVLKDLDDLLDAVQARAEEHRRTPMIGRTHGVHAEPMTFWPEAGAVARGTGPRPGPGQPGTGDHQRRQTLGRGRDLRSPRPGDRGARLRTAGAHAGAGLVADPAARSARGVAHVVGHHGGVA